MLQKGVRNHQSNVKPGRTVPRVSGSHYRGPIATDPGSKDQGI